MGVFRGLFLGGKYQPGMSPAHSLTSQVSQRPQQASVVTLSPRQPGFLARKVNSRTAQPTNVRRSMAEALVAAPQPDSSRTRRAPRIRQWSFMLKAEGRGGEAWESQHSPAGKKCKWTGLAEAGVALPAFKHILTQPERRGAGGGMSGHLLPEVENLSTKVCHRMQQCEDFPCIAVGVRLEETKSPAYASAPLKSPHCRFGLQHMPF